MDLLGRKSRRELADVRSQFAGALVALIATQTELKRTSSDYRAAIMLLMDKTEKIRDLEARLRPKPAAFSPTPLYMTEEEEDVAWQVATEILDPAIAEDILKELEFDNSEVFMDESIGISSLTY